MHKIARPAINFQNFPGGVCPRTTLGLAVLRTAQILPSQEILSNILGSPGLQRNERNYYDILYLSRQTFAEDQACPP